MPLIADRAAKRAGRIIPVVFPVSADPVGIGLAESLAQPGGNFTGFSDAHTELVPKRLELLKEIVPSISRIAIFWNPASKSSIRQVKMLREGRELG